MPTDESGLHAALQRLNVKDLFDRISYRKMMGEYLLYADGILFGGVYDDRLLIKDTKAGRAILPTAPLVLPYAGAGAKPMLFLEENVPEETIFALIEGTVASLRK
jgi:TfoX/Sxy family transcriptional regulator of competence genes